MTTPKPYFDGEKWWYSERTWRHAQQTKARAARKRQATELERLRCLGDDEADRLVGEAMRRANLAEAN